MKLATEEIMEFLGTQILIYDYSAVGLKYLSLRIRPEYYLLDLKEIQHGLVASPFEKTIIRETNTFLQTGRHAMPLDLSGFTPFQQRVFEAVSAIKPGEIITYKGIAAILGKPGAAQAVGSAVAKNPVAYFLPTHRVLPQKGLGICRSGAGHLKEKLLVLEGHELSELRGNYVCPGGKCCQE